MNNKGIVLYGAGKELYDLMDQIMDSSVLKDIVEIWDLNPNLIGQTIQFAERKFQIAAPHGDIGANGIVITSYKYFDDMKSCLTQLGISERSIYSKDQIGELVPEEIEKNKKEEIDVWSRRSKRVLMVMLGRRGTVAVGNAMCHLAIGMQERGYNVLVSNNRKTEFEDLLKAHNISAICDVRMNCNTKTFMHMAEHADYIIVNSICNYYVVSILQYLEKPVYWWLHDHYMSYEPIYKEIIEKITIDNVKIWAVSDLAGQEFERWIGHYPYQVVGLAIGDRRPVISESKKGKNEICTVAVVANISKIKGQDILLDAFEKADVNCRILFVGEYYLNNEFGEKVYERAKATDNISLTGKVSNNEVRAFYERREIDILVCPSRFETMSIATIEAMVYSIPVIVSDNTGIAEYIDHGENGLVFRSEDTRELAFCLKQLIEDDEMRKQVGDGGRKLYEEFFTPRALASKVEKLIQP